MIYDISIVGDGVVGCLTTLHLSDNYPKKKILFFSPNKFGGASRAAGAMLNVFGEVDYGFEFDDYQKKKIILGIEAQKNWELIFKKYPSLKKSKTANDTIVYCKKNSTDLEKNCFKEIKNYQNKFKRNFQDFSKIKTIAKNLEVNALYTFIKGEGAIDTRIFFKNILMLLKRKKNITFIDSEVKKILSKNKAFQLSTKNKNFKSSKVVIACGAFSKNILGYLAKDIQKNYFGIGTALEIKSNNLNNIIPKNTVLRTPNRGSTCGIHLVPRKEGEFYLGAGSNISNDPILFPRLGTVEYLITSFKNEISKDFDKSLVKPVIGYRPMSMDGKPLIGPLKNNKNIFFVSGTKRDGLTYSPIIAKSISAWLNGESLENDYFYDWSPDREPISYGDTEFAIKAYVSNKIAGLIEHEILKKSVHKVKRELEDEAYKFHKQKIMKFNLTKNFGIHPEVLNIN